MVDPMRIVLAEGGPFHARGQLDQYCRRLEATGYFGARFREGARTEGVRTIVPGSAGTWKS